MPVIIKDGKSVNIEKVPLDSASYNEDWVQELCFNHPNLLPIAELEPAFDGMVPICRELATESGYVDLLYINDDGFITVGECKLWRNPEAHRKVVGQILDYAKDLAKWDYSKFEAECLRARKGDEKTLFEIFSKDNPEIEESYFIDNIQKSLKKGRFLLLIIGDGIRENMEEMVKYIHRCENLHFTLGLIELPVFKGAEAEEELIITPRILAKTKEIERIIYSISDRSVKEESPIKHEEDRSQTISEKVYFERLAENIGAKKTEEFKRLLATLDSQFNMKPSLGRGKTIGTINLKIPNGYNFGTIYENGAIYFIGNGRWANNSESHLRYIKNIAALVNVQVDEDNVWKFIRKPDGEMFIAPDLLAVKDKWIEILGQMIDEIYQSEDD